MLMKKYLVLILFILTLCCVKSAMAADDPLKVSMELSQNRFSEPAEILVAITVTNVDERYARPGYPV